MPIGRSCGISEPRKQKLKVENLNDLEDLKKKIFKLNCFLYYEPINLFHFKILPCLEYIGTKMTHYFKKT